MNRQATNERMVKMEKKVMVSDNYTQYAYCEETDLERIDYWIFCPHDTPPGHPRTPMFDWMHMNCGNWGFNYACDKLSLPNSRGIALRSYHGYQFMTVGLPSSDDEVDARSDKFRGAIRTLIETHAENWVEWKVKSKGYVDGFKTFNFEKATWFELSRLFREVIKTDYEMYEVHLYLGEGLGAIYNLFEELCRDLLGIDESAPLFQKILTGFDNDVNVVDASLHALSVRIDELGLRDKFLDTKPDMVISEMERNESGRKWVKELRDFLHIHGWRFPQHMDYIMPTWIEDPTQPIIYIRQYSEEGSRFELDEKKKTLAEERRKAEEELIGRIPLAQRDWFKVLMNAAQQFGVWNQERLYYEMQQHAVTRHVLVEIGNRICRVGCVERPEDIFFMVPEELYKGLFDPENYSLKEKVSKRKEEWEENAKIIPPPLLAKVNLEQAGTLLLKTKDPMAVKVATGKIAFACQDPKAELVGQIASLGVAEGPARVIFSAEQLGDVQPGEILVAPTTWASWSPVFGVVKGAVIDHGGILSEPVIEGRKYGIPVVINVIHGTEKIKTGQWIKVDGNLGTVRILDILAGKKVLIVDDEPDVLDTLEELLQVCTISIASSFEEAEALLRTENFDIAVLDIMGVNGYKLLEIAGKKDVVAVMLTAHAMTLEDTIKSFEEGAAFFVPKEKMYNIATYLKDVWEGHKRGKKFWWRWFDRFGSHYDKKFGSGWQDACKWL
ncbi:response regulator receiver domain protein [delta proteobacterium NaphS2]|nr:response regulator receiver domain protein [delta proteobacterium NaphS2]